MAFRVEIFQGNFQSIFPGSSIIIPAYQKVLSSWGESLHTHDQFESSSLSPLSWYSVSNPLFKKLPEMIRLPGA